MTEMRSIREVGAAEGRRDGNREVDKGDVASSRRTGGGDGGLEGRWRLRGIVGRGGKFREK